MNNKPYVLVTLTAYYDVKVPEGWERFYERRYDDEAEFNERFVALREWARQNGYRFDWKRYSGNPMVDTLSPFD